MGVLTLAVTVTTAIEGLRGIPQFLTGSVIPERDRHYHFSYYFCFIHGPTLWDRYCRKSIRTNHVRLVYFLGVMGLLNFSQDWTVIRALNLITQSSCFLQITN